MHFFHVEHTCFDCLHLILFLEKRKYTQIVAPNNNFVSACEFYTILCGCSARLPSPSAYVHVLANTGSRWQLLTRMVVCVHGVVVLAPTHRRPCFSTYWSESIPIPIVLKLAFIRCRWRNNLRSMACFLIASLTIESIQGYSSLFF